jgi:DNA (cytosine-5)-methyltransferase 1
MDRQEVPLTLDQGKLNPVFVEYMMGLPKGWVTDMNILRSQKLKMLGNGVVPQQAYYALEQLMQSDTPSEQDLC